jgi:hypothetical protein
MPLPGGLSGGAFSPSGVLFRRVTLSTNGRRAGRCCCWLWLLVLEEWGLNEEGCSSVFANGLFLGLCSLGPAGPPSRCGRCGDERAGQRMGNVAQKGEQSGLGGETGFVPMRTGQQPSPPQTAGQRLPQPPRGRP